MVLGDTRSFDDERLAVADQRTLIVVHVDVLEQWLAKRPRKMRAYCQQGARIHRGAEILRAGLVRTGGSASKHVETHVELPLKPYSTTEDI